MDSSLNPISMNAEAMRVLSYPDKFVKGDHPNLFIAAKIRSQLISQQSSGESGFVTEFRSGKRHYFCRILLVDSKAKDPSHPYIAVLLERGPSAMFWLLPESQQFNLTPRERETLEYLLHYPSNKEIANRMGISPNTVKAFLRLIMTKMGVSSRTAIVMKMFMIRRP
jgi:DNA-binding CsgD family transcriptional regulator